MKSQLSHYQSKFNKKQFPLVLILDNVSGEANIGSIFRLADAFGVEKIIFCGIPPNLKSNRLKKTARNTHEYVKFEVFETTLEAAKFYQQQNYSLFALEITDKSIPLDSADFTDTASLALVLGSESHGIQEEVLSLCSIVLHINMFGNNSSMNVAQAAAIALYEITKSTTIYD
ncbi:TrmH family RNA methyltransferase [Zunongwangia sp. F363]|uniref:TrmH family RNA methyltransferase n=1 Tax=Autumnicola tepida TaxID=3075595 RepID=A0ABU3C6A5_9FLAO|nr:TrmH family RNA methyltransferase [Zunongwangia sp. F363]MDT0641874.1 TrmH family RNA methyltransferase [Zunongwangia sp. F363]